MWSRCPPWFDLPLLKQGQLLPKEEILGYKRTARPDSDSEKATEIEQYDRYSNKAVSESGEQSNGEGMNAQDRTLRKVTMDSSGSRGSFLRSTPVSEALPEETGSNG